MRCGPSDGLYPAIGSSAATLLGSERGFRLICEAPFAQEDASMRLDDKALQQLFLEARTLRAWQPRDVPDSLLREVVDLMKMAPTANNSLPARVVLVKSKVAKERLKPHLSPGNVDKTMSAPATAILAYDLEFYAHPPKGQNSLSGFEGKPEQAQT